MNIVYFLIQTKRIHVHVSSLLTMFIKDITYTARSGPYLYNLVITTVYKFLTLCSYYLSEHGVISSVKVYTDMCCNWSFIATFVYHRYQVKMNIVYFLIQTKRIHVHVSSLLTMFIKDITYTARSASSIDFVVTFEYILCMSLLLNIYSVCRYFWIYTLYVVTFDYILCMSLLLNIYSTCRYFWIYTP
jgi:hypothetical protein